MSDTRPFLQWTTVNMDCPDARAMADFYGRLFGWTVTYDDGNFLLMRDPAGGVGVSFQEVVGYEPPAWPEEAGRQQKQLHLEVKVADLSAAVAFVESCGGRQAAFQGREDLRVMLDPAGHPFCLYTV